jgi:hypothetical protein
LDIAHGGDRSGDHQEIVGRSKWRWPADFKRNDG